MMIDLTGDKGKYMTRMTLDGCSPVTLVGNKICFASRAAKDICVHENDKASRYKQLGILKVNIYTAS